MLKLTAPYLALTLALGLLPTTTTSAQSESAAATDWAQWRGPTRNGVTPETGWAKSWPKVKLKRAWASNVGVGYAAVSLQSDKLAITAGFRGGQDTVYCFDAKSGKPRWSYSYRAKKYDNMNAGGPAATPSVVDGRVYTISREAQMYAFDAKKGKVLWTKDLRKELGARIPQWGFSGSTLIEDGKLYVDVGVIACYDAKSGKRRWATRNYGSAYSSPVSYTREGKTYLVCFPALGLVVLDLKSGKEVCNYRWKTNYDVNAATPLIRGDEMFISSGYGTGAAMVRFDGSSLTEMWKNRSMRNHMASCVRLGDHLYGFDESQLKCLNAKDGKVLWSQRGLGKGALIMAGDKLVVLSDKGELLLADASPEGFKPVLKERVFRGRVSGAWSAPVLSHDRVYVRSPQGEVVALTIK